MRRSLEDAERPGQPARATGAVGARRGRRALAPLLVLVLACSGGLDEDTRAALVAATVPAEHSEGRRLFDASCAVCHGPAATGTPVGPPLVHAVYRPAHHGDEAFQLAAAQGVRAHHWRFGDMPPVPGLDRDDVTAITAYVRWLQREAGIE